jgi:DNA-binding CsgD family transcriptional regulator
MFVDKSWLHAELCRGRSFEEIARIAGCNGSTVAYWARKYGLRSPAADRFARRGAPERVKLEAMAAAGLTLAEMARELDRSIATVRHWLRRWGIDRADGRRRRADPATAEREIEALCRRHGRTTFRLDKRGSYRCRRCTVEQVTRWRRRLKQRLVAEAGGRCRICGYDRCQAALQFHHLDPTEKLFALSHEGATRGLERARAETSKCVLLCANCHAEVEAGFTAIEEGAAMTG